MLLFIIVIIIFNSIDTDITLKKKSGSLDETQAEQKQ